MAVEILENGAVCLGEKVVCDGYAEGRPFRVQTHVHVDHMSEFNKSKGCQDFFLSPETYDLLIAERNADLEYRENFFPMERGVCKKLDDGSTLMLRPSNHMLGACQVELALPDGLKVGYSGDFGWPLETVIQVDELILDSTYGSPKSVRNYTQDEAEVRLQEIVRERLKYGPVYIGAYRGTIERVLQVLGDDLRVPVLASQQLIREIEVYQKYGFAVGTVASLGSDDARHAEGERSYVRLYATGEGFGNELCRGTMVKCSAYMTNVDDPVRMHSDRAWSVALSNHADFNETLEYVQATGAKRVVTDNSHGGRGIELANALKERLGLDRVEAMPS